MSLNVRALKREFEVRTWSRIITENPYVAVIQITGGRAWGRTNMKARVLGDEKGLSTVNARFAVPKAAREGALRSRYVGLSELFRGGPCAVVYGNNVDDVVKVVKRAQDVIDGGIVVGGRFGNAIVTSRVWDDVLKSEGERAEWAKFVHVIGAPPKFLNILDRNAKGLAQNLEKAGGAQRLARVLERMSDR